MPPSSRRPPLTCETLERRACPAVVTIAPGFEISEADPARMLTVSLDAPVAQPVTVSYIITGTASAGGDFRLLHGGRPLEVPIGRLTFAPGEVLKPLAVVPVNDTLREGDESFTITLRPMGGVTIPPQGAAATVTIIDTDTYDVQIEPVSQGSLLVPGQPNEFVMRLVRRGQVVPATRTERFYVSTRNGSAVAGTDYLPLDRLPVTFAPGQSEQRFRVMVVDNPRNASGQYERFENVFTITTNPFDPATPTPQPVNFAVIGREPPPPALRVIAPSRPEGNEGLTEFVFTVQLDRSPTQVVTVNYATADGTAIRNEDYQPTSGVLRFGVGEMSKTVSVMVVGDRKEESDETFSLVLSNPVNATIPPNAGVGIATILDDDRGALLRQSTFTADVGWGVVDASAAVATVLGRETAFPLVADPRDVNWANNIIRAPSVWEQGITGQGITVAVIDSGVDYNHPALSQRIVRGADYIDGDLNPMDEVDFEFVLNPRNGSWEPGNLGHGTHVAGTVVAAPDRYGPAGVAYDSQVLAIRVFPSRGGASSSDINDAIRFAADSGAHVINLSLGIAATEGQLPDGVVSPRRAAIEYAVSRGSIVIVAAGNDGRLSPEFPAWLAQTPGVISVGAIDRNELRAPFSSQAGPNDRMKHVVAPGVRILSTVPTALPVGPLRDPNGRVAINVTQSQGGKYAEQPGTSMAAPHVSGVVALMLSALPDPRAPGVQELVVGALIDTARRPAGTGAASVPATPAPPASQPAPATQPGTASSDGAVGHGGGSPQRAAAELAFAAGGYAVRAGDRVIPVTTGGVAASASNPGAGWTAVAARALGPGYELLWRHTGGSMAVWTLDMGGHRVSGTAVTPAVVAAQWGDAVFVAGGPTMGGVEFGSLPGGYAVRAGGRVIPVTTGGVAASASNPGAGWTAVAARAVGSGYELLWRHTGGSMAVWTLDAGGGRIWGTAVAPTVAAAQWGDAVFVAGGQTVGGVEFGSVGGGYAVRSGGRVIPVTIGGMAASASNPGAGWTAVAARAMGSGYELLWRHAGGFTALWTLDATGARVAGRAVSGVEATLLGSAFLTATSGRPGLA